MDGLCDEKEAEVNEPDALISPDCNNVVIRAEFAVRAPAITSLPEFAIDDTTADAAVNGPLAETAVDVKVPAVETALAVRVPDSVADAPESNPVNAAD